MKKEALNALRIKDITECHHELSQTMHKLEKMRIDLRMGKTAIAKDIQKMKKDIAQIATIIKEKQK